MPTLLKIGADVTGAEKVERLAKDLREAANATDSLAKSSQKGNAEFKTMSSVMGGLAKEAEKLVGSISQTKAVLAGFKTSLDSIWSSSSVNVGLKEFQTSIKEVGRDLSYSRQQLSDFITTSGQYATLAQANAQATHATSVALRAEEAAMNSLVRMEGNYVAAKAKELLLTDKAAIALTTETAAINAQIAAYQKLNASGKMGNYEKGFDYVATLKAENASIAAQERGLATLAQQFSALKSVRSTLKQGSYAAEIAAENASIAAQERGLKELEAQFRKTAVARSALKQGSYAVSDYAQSGRDKLAAGSVAGGYDYAEQLKKESILYDEVSGKAKNYPPILTKLGQAWDDAGKKSSVFHNLMRGASGAMGTLWLTYGQMIPMIAGFATAAAALESVDLATEFDYTTRMIQALSDGSLKGAEGLELIRDSLLGIKDVVSTPQQLAAGLLELARAGVDAKEGLVELEEISRFATLAEIDLGKAVELLVGQTKAFKDVDMSQAANIVAKVADDTSVSISQMTEAFKNTTELGTVMGAKFLDVATALGIMADHGIRGASAGTSLRTSMLQLISPTESAQKALDKYFVTFSAIDPITGKVKDLKTMVGELSKATSHLSSGELTIILEKLTGNRSIKAIGALINATREEEKQLAKTSEAVKLHSKTWTEAEQVYKQAMGSSADVVSYLKKLDSDMTESGRAQFKKLRADFERLAIGSVKMKGVTEAVKEFRNIVNDPAMKQSLSFLLEVLTKIAGFSFKNVSNALIELRNLNDAFHGKVDFSQVLGATSGEEQKKLAEDIDRGTEELAKSISNAQDKVKSLQGQITKGVDIWGNFLDPEELDKLNTKLETAEYQLAGFKETYDKTVNGPKLTDSLGLNKAEIETAIGYAETRIKTLQKMVSTGKAPVGGYLDNEGLANANKDLVEAKQHLVDLQAQLASVGQVGSKGFSDVGSAAEETAGSVAADMERMYADIEEKSGSYLAQWENSMLKARDEIQTKLLTPGSDKYEPPLAGEDGVAYMQRIKEIADGWDEANRKMNESEQIKAKLKDLKPASDTLKQLASDTAQMEAIFAEQKATLESQAIENQTDYEKGLKSHSQYWNERLRITEQSLTAELGLREAAMREAQAAYDQYVTNFGTDQADEELVGKQIELQKKLAESQKAVAEIKGKILNTQKQSNAEADKEANTYAVDILRAQAELLNLKGEIYSEDALIYEATLKQLQADQLSLQYGDEQLNAIKLQVIELKKLEAATKTTYEAMQKGMKEAAYSGKEMAEDIQRATENAFDSMTDAIVDFVKTGKMNFSDLTDSILTDLLSIMVRANVTNTILSALGMSSYTGLGTSNQAATTLGMDTSQLSSGGGIGNMLQSSTIGEGYDYVSSLFSSSAAGSSAAYSSAAYGSSAWDLGSVYGEGAYGSAASEIGSSASPSGWGGLSTEAQTGWSSGALAFVASLLSGEDVDVAAVKGVGAGGGAYLGAQAGTMIWPGVGTAAGGVIGGILGALGAGSLLDNGPDTFQAGYMSDAVGVNYDAVKGMVPTTTQFTGGDTDSQIAAIYAPAMRAIQEAFDANVTALSETLPEEMSAGMIESLAGMDLEGLLDKVSAGEIEVGNVDSWLTKVAEDYAEGLALALGEAFGDGLASFISTKGAEGLVGDSAAWAVLTDAVKENITNSFQEAATQIAGGDIDGGLASIQSVTDAIAAIDAAMEPIQEIVDTKDLSDYALGLREINNQFDTYDSALKAAGVDLDKFTASSEARTITINKYIESFLEPFTELMAEVDTTGLTEYGQSIYDINDQYVKMLELLTQAGLGDLGTDQRSQLDAWKVAKENVLKSTTISEALSDMEIDIKNSGLTELQVSIQELGKQAQDTKNIITEASASTEQIAVVNTWLSNQLSDLLNGVMEPIREANANFGLTELEISLNKIASDFDALTKSLNDLGNATPADFEALKTNAENQLSDLLNGVMEPIREANANFGLTELEISLNKIASDFDALTKSLNDLGNATPADFEAIKTNADNKKAELFKPTFDTIEDIIVDSTLTDFGKSMSTVKEQFEGENGILTSLIEGGYDLTDANLAYALSIKKVQDAVKDPVMQDVNTIIKNDGLSEFIINLNSLDEKFDTYAATVAEAGGSLQDIIDIEKARLIEVTKVYAGAISDLADAEQALADLRLSVEKQLLTEILTAANNLLNEATTNLNASFSKAQEDLTKQYEANAERLNDELDAAKESVSAMKSLTDSFKSALNSMRLETEQFKTNQRLAAQSELKTALAAARVGDFEPAKNLDSAVSTLTSTTPDMFGSSEDYQRDFWASFAGISELEGLTGSKLSIEERSVTTLEAQLEANTVWYDQQKEILTTQLEAILGTKEAVLSLSEATSAYYSAFNAQVSAATSVDKANASTEAADRAKQLKAAEDAVILASSNLEIATRAKESAELSLRLAEEANKVSNLFASSVNTALDSYQLAFGLTAVDVTDIEDYSKKTLGIFKDVEKFLEGWKSTDVGAYNYAATQRVSILSGINAATSAVYGIGGSVVGAINSMSAMMRERLTPTTASTNTGTGAVKVGGSFAVGANYIPYDMVAQLHEGETVVPAAYSRSDSTNTEIVNELRSLKSGLMAVTLETAKNTNKMATLLDAWDGDGMPEERVI